MKYTVIQTILYVYGIFCYFMWSIKNFYENMWPEREEKGSLEQHIKRKFMINGYWDSEIYENTRGCLWGLAYMECIQHFLSELRWRRYWNGILLWLVVQPQYRSRKKNDLLGLTLVQLLSDNLQHLIIRHL